MKSVNDLLSQRGFPSSLFSLHCFGCQSSELGAHSPPTWRLCLSSLYCRLWRKTSSPMPWPMRRNCRKPSTTRTKKSGMPKATTIHRSIFSGSVSQCRPVLCRRRRVFEQACGYREHTGLDTVRDIHCDDAVVRLLWQRLCKTGRREARLQGRRHGRGSHPVWCYGGGRRAGSGAR